MAFVLPYVIRMSKIHYVVAASKKKSCIQGSYLRFLRSSGYGDELVFAAAMLYKATGEANYLEDAEMNYDIFGFDYQTSWAFDWDDKLMGAKVLLLLLLLLFPLVER